MNFGKAFSLRSAALLALCGFATPVWAQQEIDRADPAVAERELSNGLTNIPDARVRFPAVANLKPAATSFVGDVLVGAIAVDGARTFRAADFAPVIAPYVGRTLDATELKALAQSVADLARARGYVFASAWVPQQTVANGVLRVRLDEGRIDEVRVSGSTDPAIARTLAVLSDGRPVTRARVERALLLAGDLPGVRIAKSTYQREGERGVLAVESRKQTVVGNVQIDNWGSRAVGPFRVRMRADLMGAVLKGDQLTLRGTLTPFQPKELATGGFDYSVDTGADGLLAGIGASYTRVQPGRRPQGSEVDGRSVSLNANLNYPLQRTLDANIWATADLTVRDVEQDREDALVRADRLTTLTLGVSAYRRMLGGWFNARLSARQGLNMFDATKRGDPLASRSGGSGIFSKVELFADWTGPLSGPLSLRVAADGQLSTRALLSSEEMGIGGPRFGRAYDYSERTGDRGIAGLAELRYDIRDLPAASRAPQIYAFADAGHVGNVGRGGRGGSLYSAGFGARVELTRTIDAGVELGFPIGKDRFETNDRSPRVSFTLSSRF